VGAVVLTVIVALTAEVPLMSTEDGMLHVAGSIAPEGLDVREHLRLTAPTKPASGFTAIVEVLPEVAPALTVTAVPDKSKLPTALLDVTAKLIVLVSVTEPLVPVRVTT
jgi:hypothetical protein